MEDYRNRLKVQTLEQAAANPSPGLSLPINTMTSNSTPATINHNDALETLRVVGKELMKPVGAVATITEQAGIALGRKEFAPLKEIPSKVKDIATGKTERSFTELFKEQPQFQYEPTTSVFKNFMNEIPALFLGTTMDILADPLTYLGGGLTRQGVLASKVTSLAKAGEKIAPGSKLAKAVVSNKYTPEQLTLGATKAEQAAKGQHAVLTFAGKSILPAKMNTTAYKSLSFVNDLLSGTTAGSGVKKLISTKTASKDFNLLVSHYRSLGDYRRATILENAKLIQDRVKKLSANQITEIGEYLEKGVIPKSNAVKELGDDLKAAYADFKKLENELGIKTAQVEEYAPHVKAKEPLAGKAKQFFNSPREWSAKLNATKGRQILKFVDEAGNEFVGTAGKTGLKEVPTFKGLAKELTMGEFTTIKQIEEQLAKYGIKLRFKNKALVRGSARGYWDSIKKEIVIAGARRLDDIVTTTVHEITHSADFQTGGLIAMMDTFAGKGTKIAKEYNAARSAVRTEWEGILRANGIGGSYFKNLSKSKQNYFKEPTELLSRAMQIYARDSALAKKLFPKTTEAINVLRKQKYNKLYDLASNAELPGGGQSVSRIFRDGKGNFYSAKQASVDEINKTFQRQFFETNPAIQYANRGLASSKAVTSKQFLNDVKKFATEVGVESTAPELKGLKFNPEIARVIDSYVVGLKPEELKIMYKVFSTAQNWWKAQALISPSYHLRNTVGNIWNNFLAGVKNPLRYVEAGNMQLDRLPKTWKMVDDAGRAWTKDAIVNNAKRTGVLNQGWYAADIPEAIGAQIERTVAKGINPLSQSNYAFRLNKAVGTAIENNARLAHFIEKLKQGYSVDHAAASVKKYLFDYGDLTDFEKKWLKGVAPFYTWTRKNVPLQLEHLITQPGKYAGMEKIVRAVEQLGMKDSPRANEKYLNEYIRDNSPMRIKYNKKDDTYYYFLLGEWVPSYAAIDVLSQPLQNMMGLLTPFLKTPIEVYFNKSSFFRNTLGQASFIENTPGDFTSYLGFNMPKKTAIVLRNIRLLNELDKLNPGKIFGGVKGEESIWKKMNFPAIDLPRLGTISPSAFNYSASGAKPTGTERATGLFLGKMQAYKPDQARSFYNRDTQNRIDEMELEIKKAARAGDIARVKIKKEKLREFIKSR